MDGIAKVAGQQQSQVQQQSQINSPETQVNTTLKPQQQTSNATDAKSLQEMSEAAAKKEPSINSKKDVEELVAKLNDAMAPMSTNIKFGVDLQDIFYVSVIEANTNKMIRRFPAEQAQDFLPKMQEVSGILFDAVG